MKKITFFVSMMITSLGFSQMPTTAAPLPPVRQSTDVISIYGSAYTNISGVNINPFWYQNTIVSEVSISGNNAIQYLNFNYQGTDWANNAQNISGMEFLHVDIWTNSQAPNVYVISSGTEISHPISSITGSWQSLNIPVSGITGNLNNAIQFKFDGGTGGTIYLDNLYFWKNPAAAGSDASLSDLKINGTTLPGFVPSGLNYVYELVVGTTIVPQITAATTTDSNANAVINQATNIPGNATVIVTSQNGSVIKTYTISFSASLPSPSPTPSTPNSQVLSVYGDTGNFTNIWSSNYNFGSFASTPDLDLTSLVNQAIKMDFSIGGYGQGTNSPTNISSYNYINFDYFVDPTAVPGVNGDQVQFILISGTPPGSTTEASYVMTPSGVSADGILVKGSWKTLSLPLSVFVGKGFNKTNFLQFKLGTDSILNTKTVYFDNIYFSMNQGTVLNNDSFNSSIVGIYPNPTSDNLTITSKSIMENVSIYNLLGQEVMSISPKAETITINISDFKVGVYVIKATINGVVSTSRIVKE